MFDNFQNIPADYTPNNFQTAQNTCSAIEPKNPNKPYEIKNITGELLGYFWYYGNSIDLTFDIYDNSDEAAFTAESTYVTIQDYLQFCDLTVTLFDAYNWSIVHQEKLQAKGNVVTLHINAELSSKIVKGKYRIQLVASHPSGYNETIFSTDDCILEVR